MKVRKLKVYEGTGRNYKTIPKVNLQGKWLAELGFSVGSPIEVQCSEKMLVIKADNTTNEKK